MSQIRAVGYARVSTADQPTSLEDQRTRIQDECVRRGWLLRLPLFEGVASGRTTNGRASLQAALDLLDAGEADCLITTKADRLTRSVVDLGQLIQRAAKHGWQLVVLDLNVDMTTPTGEMVANIVVSVAQWERRMIGVRTRDALAVKRRNGTTLGRPRTLPDRVRRRIRRMHGRGANPAAIARALNDDGIPTAQGGKKWHPSTVRKVLLTK